MHSFEEKQTRGKSTEKEKTKESFIDVNITIQSENSINWLNKGFSLTAIYKRSKSQNQEVSILQQ